MCVCVCVCITIISQCCAGYQRVPYLWFVSHWPMRQLCMLHCCINRRSIYRVMRQDSCPFVSIVFLSQRKRFLFLSFLFSRQRNMFFFLISVFSLLFIHLFAFRFPKMHSSASNHIHISCLTTTDRNSFLPSQRCTISWRIPKFFEYSEVAGDLVFA